MQANSGVHEKESFDFLQALKEVRENPRFHEVGAIATFTGVVRGETLNAEKVERLELEAYEDKASEVLTRICDDLKKRPGIVDVQIHHLLGEFTVGEDLVYVVVAGSHRKEVFDVLEEAVDRYKSEAPIFKKEHVTTREGKEKAYWVAERKGSRKQ
jgi:molybdopterin synthase catalytic subunit